MENNNFDEEIKLNKWDKKIKINENGDYIILHIGDLELVNKINKILGSIEKDFKETHDKIEKENDKDKSLEMTINFSKSLCNKINSLFNDNNLCIKLFGTEAPYIDDLFGFISQICNIVEKYTGEKIESLKTLDNTYKKSMNGRLGARI